jgi:deoxyribonuclease-4
MKYGLHIATAGDIVGTPARAHDMGADTIQIFASNPRGWRQTIYDAKKAQAFQDACKQAEINPVFIHMIYLVSYGTPDDELRGKSVTALHQMLQTAESLGVKGVVTHMGSHKGAGFAQSLPRTVKSLTAALEDSSESYLILENSAGAGGNIGNSLDELAAIIDGLDKHPRLKICLDTCHLLASGYEIRTPDGLEKTLDEFDQKIGLDRLVVMHLNDSKGDLGSNLDRHENIGDGFIGNVGFKVILNHPALKDVSGVLEVPGLDDKGPDAANLERLRKLTV